MTWIEILRELLCRIYQQWGGNCDDLGQTESAWVATVCNEYEQEGLPAFANQQERDDYIQLLTDLENHLNENANTLSSGDDADLRQLIADLRADLGIGP